MLVLFGAKLTWEPQKSALGCLFNLLSSLKMSGNGRKFYNVTINQLCRLLYFRPKRDVKKKNGIYKLLMLTNQRIYFSKALKPCLMVVGALGSTWTMIDFTIFFMGMAVVRTS
ncbi:MAG: hypothetical protein D3926_08205 [Desulfobacteraceae bacterium]|nr:MAG: hypothetical protein D3926_08205 [Desulfobacteraceae bacterium]